MALDSTNGIAQNAIDGSKRKEALVVEAFNRFSWDVTKVNDYLSTRHVNVGNQTVLEMAEASEAGLQTAKCLLEPRSGC